MSIGSVNFVYVNATVYYHACEGLQMPTVTSFFSRDLRRVDASDPEYAVATRPQFVPVLMGVLDLATVSYRPPVMFIRFSTFGRAPNTSGTAARSTPIVSKRD